MKAGISSYTYTWAIGVPGKEPANPMTVFHLLQQASELGAEVVQIADNMPLDSFSEMELDEIKAYASQLQVQVEVGARKMTDENLERYINLALFFGSPILRFVIDGKGFEPSLDEVHAIISRHISTLEMNNIILAIENHDRFKAVQFAEMIEKAQSHYVGICLDTVNSMGAGEGLETTIGHLAPLTVNLHVKEFSIKRVYHQMGFVTEGCPLGQGMLPLKDLIKKVPHHCGSAILEQWTPPEAIIADTIRKEGEWAVKSFRYLKKAVDDHASCISENW